MCCNSNTLIENQIFVSTGKKDYNAKTLNSANTKFLKTRRRRLILFFVQRLSSSERAPANICMSPPDPSSSWTSRSRRQVSEASISFEKKKTHLWDFGAMLVLEFDWLKATPLFYFLWKNKKKMMTELKSCFLLLLFILSFIGGKKEKNETWLSRLFLLILNLLFRKDWEFEKLKTNNLKSFFCST